MQQKGKACPFTSVLFLVGNDFTLYTIHQIPKQDMTWTVHYHACTLCVVIQLKQCHHQSDLVPKTQEPHMTMNKLFIAVAYVTIRFFVVAGDLSSPQA